MIHVTAMIHHRAEVEDNCSVGRLTRVWQFASVIREAVIGEECRIASCAIVDGARMGNRCIVSHGAFLDPGIRIGDDVFIGPNVAFCNDFWPRTEKADWFDIRDLIVGRSIVTMIGNGASLGAGTILMPGIVVGDRAMVAAGAIVTSDVKKDHLWRRDGTMVEIDPARVPNRMRVVI